MRAVGVGSFREKRPRGHRNRAKQEMRRRIRRRSDEMYRMHLNWMHAKHRAVKEHKTVPMPRLPN